MHSGVKVGRKIKCEKEGMKMKRLLIVVTACLILLFFGSISIVQQQGSPVIEGRWNNLYQSTGLGYAYSPHPKGCMFIAGISEFFIGLSQVVGSAGGGHSHTWLVTFPPGTWTIYWSESISVVGFSHCIPPSDPEAIKTASGTTAVIGQGIGGYFVGGVQKHFPVTSYPPGAAGPQYGYCSWSRTEQSGFVISTAGPITNEFNPSWVHQAFAEVTGTIALGHGRVHLQSSHSQPVVVAGDVRDEIKYYNDQHYDEFYP